MECDRCGRPIEEWEGGYCWCGLDDPDIEMGLNLDEEVNEDGV